MKSIYYYTYKVILRIENFYRNKYLKNYYKERMKYFGENILILGRVTFSSIEKIRIGSNTTLNEGVYINGDYEVEIGENCSISANSMIISTELDKEELIKNSKKVHLGNKIKIGNYVQIGAGAIILQGVQIGNNVIVGAGSVIKKNIPSNSIVYGNPLKIIKI